MSRTTIGAVAVFVAMLSVPAWAIQQSAAERDALKSARILDITGVIYDIVGVTRDVSGTALDVDRVLKDLGAKVSAGEIAIALAADVLFDFDQAVLKPTAEQSLQRVLAVIKAKKGAKVSVVGHTDVRGDEAYNLALSNRRANAVKTWFVAHAIPPQRLTASGAGESTPLTSGDTEESHRANRRVEIRITDFAPAGSRGRP